MFAEAVHKRNNNDRLKRLVRGTDTVKKLSLIFIALLLCVSIFATVPKNVVVLVGDGMGLNQLYLSTLLTSAKGEPVFTDRFPVCGFGQNWTADNLITDSAAAATAIFSGILTKNGFVGLDENGNSIANIADILKEKGWHTGVITNTRYYDATPSGLYGHAARKDLTKLTSDLLESDLDLLMAGGLEKLGINPFTQKPNKNSKLWELAEKGYKVMGINFRELSEPSPEYKGLRAFVAMGDKNFENDLLDNEPTLPEMVAKGLEYLPREKVFLMVEAGRIDDACHVNDTEAVKSELVAFQRTLGVLLETFSPEDTLFIILADHETGGLAVIFGQKDSEDLSITWSHSDHTAAYVPIMAMGPDQEKFAGIYHISNLPGKILETLEVE